MSFSAVRISAARVSKPRGRYDGGRDVRLPAAGIARGAPSLHIRTAVGAVQNPERGNERVAAAISTSVDVLEADLSRGAISEPAYAMGRTLQALWERADGARLGSTWVGEWSGGDPGVSLERRILGVIVDAKTIVAMERKIADLVGMVGTRFLRRVLIGGRTYGEIAKAEGKAGDRGTAYIAD